MGNLKPNTFYVVQSWMVDELKLSGTELQLFAIIYGFSQDGMSAYCGSSSYLMSWTNVDRSTIHRCLKKLVKDGLIVKDDSHLTKGINAPHYSVNNEVVNRCCKLQQGVLQNTTGGVANCNRGCGKMQHNINNNKNINNNIYMPQTKNSFNRIETHKYDEEEYERNILGN